MALHMHQGSCRLELWSAINLQSRLCVCRKSSWSFTGSTPKLLPVSVFDTIREHTYSTCAAIHVAHTYSICSSHGAYAKHACRTYAAVEGAPRSSFFQCSTFSPVCRLVHMRGFLKRGLTCSYGNTFIDLGSAMTMEWRPAFDNVLLVASIALAYIAGIVTPSSPASSVFTTSAPLNKSQEILNVQEEANEAISLEEEDLWSEVRLKLLKSIDVADDIQEDMSGQGVKLSLQALARGPRLRLLLTTLEHLNKEVCNLQQNENFMESEWAMITVQMLCRIIVPICRSWMCEEHLQTMKNQISSDEDCVLLAPGLFATNKQPSQQLDKVTDQDLIVQWNLLFDSYSQNYDGSKPIIASLQATGKTEFYSDFLYFIRFGCVRVNGFSNLETFKRYKGLVLEDLIIFVADKASALYLDLISTGNPACDNQWLNIMVNTVSSTRLLEKFRNEVALNGWLNENFQSVVAMFEDRFDLSILKSGAIKCGGDQSIKTKKQSNDRAENIKEREHSELVIGEYKLSARRVRELRALTGWRYYFSLYLEFSDICGPLLRTVLTKLGEGISFLLVILIGRSLGLIYRGIRQSVQWPST